MAEPTRMSRYHAFLLRIWRDNGAVGAPPGPWRFSLEDPASGDRRGFRSLAELSAFLNLTCTSVPAAAADRPVDATSITGGNS